MATNVATSDHQIRANIQSSLQHSRRHTRTILYANARFRRLTPTTTEGGKPAGNSEGVKFLRMEANAAVFSTGSGSYTFVAK